MSGQKEVAGEERGCACKVGRNAGAYGLGRLDSLEAIDADRIAALVEYFTDFVPFLVVGLLPEDAAALPEEYDRVRMGGTAD